VVRGGSGGDGGGGGHDWDDWDGLNMEIVAHRGHRRGLVGESTGRPRAQRLDGDSAEEARRLKTLGVDFLTPTGPAGSAGNWTPKTAGHPGSRLVRHAERKRSISRVERGILRLLRMTIRTKALGETTRPFL